MEYSILGSTGIRISRLGFGCMSIHPGHPHPERLIDHAISKGINYFDTADLYDKGWNEEMLGRALTGKRNQIVIATKVGNQWKEDGSGWNWNPRKDYITSAVEQSLRRLGTDYIDLYQLHGGTLDDPTDETIEAFEQLKAQGKIRAYGISSIRPNVIRTWLDRSAFSSLMTQYSLIDRRPEEEVLSLMTENNIALMVRGALAQGLLAGKPAQSALGYSPEQIQQLIQAIDDVRGTRKRAQVALGFVLAHPGVSSALVGISRPEQLDDVVGYWQHPPLTEGEVHHLSTVLPANRYQEYR